MSQSLASSQFGVRPAIDSLASLDPDADKLAYYTDVDAAALADLSAFARTVLDDVDAAAVRTTIGAGTGSGDMLGANNLSDVADAATSRTNLGLGNVDNTSDANKPVSTAQQTALNLKANIASPTFTGTVTIPTPFTLGAVSVLPTGTELNFVDGVTSGIQGQIDGKQPLDTQLTSVAALAYAGNALKVVRVNAGETDFELTTPAVGTVTNVTGTAPIASSGGATPAISLNTAGVTFAKIQDIATDSLIGRDTAGSGVPENILLNATLSMDGSGNLQRAALSGDVTASAGSNSTTLAAGSAAVLNSGILLDARMPNLTGDVTTVEGAVATTIANDAVTYAKMQNVSATDKVLGRSTAGAGDVEEIACTANARTMLAKVAPWGVYNAATSIPGAGFSSDTYLVGSSCAIPNSSLQAKSIYHCVIRVSKTAAGTATPILNLRFGTGGTTSDASLGTYTFTAGTAAADEGVFEVWATFNSVGSGTSAVINGVCSCRHKLSVTGITGAAAVSEAKTAVSGGFDSTVSSSIIGVSLNAGASASWTVSQVISELVNLN